MAGQSRRNGGTENRIPERVENAAQSMMNNASFPRRKYAPNLCRPNGRKTADNRVRSSLIMMPVPRYRATSGDL